MHGLLTGVAGMIVPVEKMWLVFTPVKTIITVMIVIAVLRGILHYVEQYCNHFIAFKLLAIIRHKVFAALRKLCPAKLEGRDKGNLISIITTDIELLEVFYAHTISPIAIATLTSIIMVIFIGRYHWLAGVLALAAYLLKRPVKVKLTRQESILIHPKRHPMDMKFTVGCDENGIIQGVMATVISDTGAYASLGGPVLERACTHAAGPYNYQNFEIDGKAYYTNNPPAGAFRGFGVTQLSLIHI